MPRFAAPIAIAALLLSSQLAVADTLLVQLTRPQSADPEDSRGRRTEFFWLDTDSGVYSPSPFLGSDHFSESPDFAFGGDTCDLLVGANFRSYVQRFQGTTGLPYAKPLLSRNDTFTPGNYRFLSTYGATVGVVDSSSGNAEIVVEERMIGGVDGATTNVYDGFDAGLRDALVTEETVYVAYWDFETRVATVIATDRLSRTEAFRFTIPDFELNVIERYDGDFYLLGYTRTEEGRQGLTVRKFDGAGVSLGTVVPEGVPGEFRLLAATESGVWVATETMILGHDRETGVEIAAFPVPIQGQTVDRFTTLSCDPRDTTATFYGGAFEAAAWYETGEGATGKGHALPTDSSSTLRLWFFEPDNEELLLKVLDGCGVNGHYWVFFAATTDVGFELTVTETATGAEKTYVNPLGQPASAVADTEAFPCGT